MPNRIEQLSPVIDQLLAKGRPIVVAIDGKCTSGKTTLARELAQIYDCNVFHMDDFFLRPEQRTRERLEEIGGNVDYERFQAEVVDPLKAGVPFSYRPFDCKTQSLLAPVPVEPKALTIVEGSYSLHPYFGEPYDLRILLTISPEQQHQRILERPAFLHQRFFEMWIPMENRYLDAFQIENRCDLIL